LVNRDILYYNYCSIKKYINTIAFIHIAENPDLVKPVITIVDEKKLTIEFVLPEIAAIERKANIESEKCIPIINKVYKRIEFI